MPNDTLLTTGLAFAGLLVAAPAAVAKRGGEDIAYELGHRAGQIAGNALFAALILGAILGGAALVRRVVRRRRPGGPPG